MDPVPTSSPPSQTEPRSHLWTSLSTFVLAVLLVSWSLLRVSMPGVNEPHYLAKSRHYWNPDWGAGDLFLESSNPHLVFYATFGWLTEVASFPVAATIGRIVALSLLAIGWMKLGRAVTGSRLGAVTALPLFLVLHAFGNWSGEWLVGGVESKVVSYAVLFWGLGAWLDRQPLRAAAGLGLAVSFHPIVGIWGVVCGAFVEALCFVRRWFESPTETAESGNTGFQTRRSVMTAVAATFLGLLCALPGLIPALQSLRSSDPATTAAAVYLQVAHRLSHHLDPLSFPTESHRYFALLIVIWGLLLSAEPRRRADDSWRAFVIAALLIAGVGVFLAAGPRPMKLMPGYVWRVNLLRFYPFRLADLMLPMAVSFAGARWILSRWMPAFSRPQSAVTLREGQQALLLGTLLGAVYLISISIPGVDRNPSRLDADRREAWIDAATWIREQTSPTAVVHAVDVNWAVKWFMQRPEFVNYKDMPQDAPSIVEWNNRLWTIANWRIAAFADGRVSVNDLTDLHAQTGITYLICHNFGPINAEPAYQNREFRIYELRPAASE